MKTITTVALMAAVGVGVFLVAKSFNRYGGGRVASIVNGAARATGLPYLGSSFAGYDNGRDEPNATMPIRNQREEYGAGRRVAEVYAAGGMLDTNDGYMGR